MRPFLLAAFLIAAPAATQTMIADQNKPATETTATDPTTKATPAGRPTKVVARSDRLVTARTTSGRTQSYNCDKPANRKLRICKH